MLSEHHARAKQLCRQGAFAGYTGDILTLDLASNALAPLDLGVNPTLESRRSAGTAVAFYRGRVTLPPIREQLLALTRRRPRLDVDPFAEQLRTLIRRQPQVFAGIVVAMSVAMWVLVGTTVAFGMGAIRGLPNSEAVRTVGQMSQATTLVDVKGRHAFTIFQERRLHVPLENVSPNMVRAIVAAEDQRFYRHGGFDVIRVMGAGWNNLLAGRAEQGGSTITQQLARLAFLTPDKTFRRKLQEVVVAIQLERAFSKDEILELYLNKAYFGDGLYAVEAASLGDVGKHAHDLDVADAAM